MTTRRAGLFLYSLTLFLVAAVVSSAQVIRSSALPGMEVSNTFYDWDAGELEVELTCVSEVPITAWAVDVWRRYSDDSTAMASVVSDYAIQLAFNDRPTGSPEDDSGVCYSGQKRRHTWQIAPTKQDYLLTSLDVHIAALVYADKKGRGDREHIRRIIELRTDQLEAAREWQEELEQILATGNPRANVAALRQAKQAQAEALASHTPFDNPIAVRARERTKDLARLEMQMDQPNLDPKAVLEFVLDLVKRGILSREEHAAVREVQ